LREIFFLLAQPVYGWVRVKINELSPVLLRLQKALAKAGWKPAEPGCVFFRYAYPAVNGLG
jgi:hypothetical protein